MLKHKVILVNGNLLSVFVLHTGLFVKVPHYFCRSNMPVKFPQAPSGVSVIEEVYRGSTCQSVNDVIEGD